jgi:probable phosphoglycerate mutase
MTSSKLQLSIPEILVLRHGQTEWNVEGRLQGNLDSPLTRLGLGQAETQNKTLRTCDLSGFRVFCSPHLRAQHTARIALEGLGMVVETSSDLTEIDMDAWSGRYREEIAREIGMQATDLTHEVLYNSIPSGEGLNGLYNRCAQFLKRLEGPSILVTHGVISRCLRLSAMKEPVANLWKLPGGQGVIYRVKQLKHTLV